MPKTLPPILSALGADQEKSIRLLVRRLEDARKRGDSEGVHACLDALVVELLDMGDVDEAERCVNELLTMEQDATHVLLHARVLESRGMLEASRIERARAATLVNSHLDDYERQLLEEAGIVVTGLRRKKE